MTPLERSARMAVQAMEKATEALSEIALAGMTLPSDASEEAKRDFHARQAWHFIGIAARAKDEAYAALSSLREALDDSAQEPEGATSPDEVALEAYWKGFHDAKKGLAGLSDENERKAAAYDAMLAVSPSMKESEGSAAPDHAADASKLVTPVEPCRYPACGCPNRASDGMPDCEGAKRAIGVSSAEARKE